MKLKNLMAMGVAALAMTACVNDNEPCVEAGLATANFNISYDAQMLTKAQAGTLYYSINGVKHTAESNIITAEVEVNTTHTFGFWHSGDGETTFDGEFTSDLTNENSFANVKRVNITSNIYNDDVELVRPYAKIVVKSKNEKVADQANITIDGLGVKYNVLTKEVVEKGIINKTCVPVDYVVAEAFGFADDNTKTAEVTIVVNGVTVRENVSVTKNTITTLNVDSFDGNPTVNITYADWGKGTELNESTADVRIHNLAELKEFRDNVNAGNTYAGKTIKLMADIDLHGEEWTPIGDATTAFKGNFNGQGLTISNLNINMPTGRNVGFFGNTESGSVKNLVIKNAKVVGSHSVGVVAGRPYTSKYENITVTGVVTVDGKYYVGGVLGYMSYASCKNLTVNASIGSYVNANSVLGETEYFTYVGGVIGFTGEGNYVFENLKSNIDVTGTTYGVGGIVGIANYGNTYKNCVSTGNVTISDAVEVTSYGTCGFYSVGGIAGVWNSSKENNNVTFISCWSKGEIKSFTKGFQHDLVNDHSIVGNAWSKEIYGQLIIE
jgi:hypothetical protein